MSWELDSKRPIYEQLAERIRERIVTGVYPGGERLPSVRDLAQEAGVNPNTMQRALTELERAGVLFSQRTSGRYVTEDEAMIRQMKEEAARETIEEFLEKMRALGISTEEVIEMLGKEAAQ